MLPSSASPLNDEDPKGRHELETRRGVRDAGAGPALTAGDEITANGAGESGEAAECARAGDREGEMEMAGAV
jgi:hypothetical protein